MNGQKSVHKYQKDAWAKHQKGGEKDLILVPNPENNNNNNLHNIN